ncbi:MAG: cytochrome b N-terminal domain-containing protein [Alphaproteobacteria bacterium]|nr:cytochrome b N-terminal domain-containing protein [Alphaproteobacteria bacterium]
MRPVQAPLRAAFDGIEAGLNIVFPPSWNPLRNLGALAFFMYWIVAVSGIYVYIFFDTGLTEAYDSVEYMTHDQWYLAGVMRSLHRYASDGMVLFMLVHMLREFALDRYRGPRWFTWVTGVPILLLVIMAGISGYWLVWDRLAQYVAIATTEWFDWLPIFGQSIARNFLTTDSLDDRFFTLMIFIHIAVPLILLFILWVHLQRVSRPEINPPRGLAIGSFLMLLGLSLVYPAVSQGPADLSTVVSVVGLDWFYLGLYPLVDYWSSGTVWGFVTVLGLILIVLPWMPPMRRAPAAQVDPAHCNGCTWCLLDCPYNAIEMGPRTDNAAFDQQAVVDPSLCVRCGICAASCPSSTPFRKGGEVLTGIDLPGSPLNDLRQRMVDVAGSLSGDARILVIGCGRGVPVDSVASPSVAALTLPCVGNLPPSFVDFAVSRDLADGVMLAGCRDGDCHFRFGIRWTEERVDRERDPRLRVRVPRGRLAYCWSGPGGSRRLRREITAFAERLKAMPKRPRWEPAAGPPPAPTVELEPTGSDG